MKTHRHLIVVIMIGFCLLLPFIASGCSASNEQNGEPEGYPISSEVYTSRERTIIPDPAPSGTPISISEVSKFAECGYGGWSYGPGVDSGKRLDIMPSGYDGSTAINEKRLLNFFTISDLHVADKETPAQAIYYGYKSSKPSSQYTPCMLYTTQVLDAAIQTINFLHRKDAFDFGLSLGDDCDSTQYNELRWAIDVIDGKEIYPYSGVKSDPVPGPLNDYQDKYKAAGLANDVKWYAVIGNHDHFWKGSFPPNDYIRQMLTGDTIISLGEKGSNKLTDLNGRAYYMGCIDGRTVFGDIMGVGSVEDFTSPPKVLAADANRRSLTRYEWIGEFFNTASNPTGHGFAKTNTESGFACYTFEPKSTIPVRVIVLDDTQNDDTASNNGYAHGDLDEERYQWLVTELDKGQAEGKLMIIAAHSPITSIPSDADIGWNPDAEISQKDLISKLHNYPNLILVVTGHWHLNKIAANVSPDPNHPENGFWEVQTSSLRDFPNQFRTFEIFKNKDNTISIIATNVNPAIKEGTPADTARTYSVATHQISKRDVGSPSGSFNAELIKQLSPEMEKKLAKVK